MRPMARGFTMRRDGVLPRGDWFNIVAQNGATKVYIYDEIGFWGTSAQDFVDKINEIDGNFELHLNSPGGEIFDGMAIYNSIRNHPGQVTVYVDGLAASAASFIAQAGDQVIMANNAQMMIHDGIAFAYGNEQDMLDTAAILSKLSNSIAGIYALHAGKRGEATTEEEFRALMREEVWYSGREAVTAGLADVVADEDNEEADKAAAKWDLSFYNHAGRERATSPLHLLQMVRLENRTENNMSRGSTPSNTDTPPEAPEAPEVPEAPETDTAPEGDPAPEAPEAPEQPTDSSTTPTPPTPPTPQPSPTPSNAVQGVLIDGVMVTDFAVINRHMQTLQAAQAEQTETFRAEFVENLARENKIPATQVDSLVALVNGTDQLPGMTDEQFAAFQASYESSAPSSLFGAHATDQTRPGQGADSRETRIQTLQGIVDMHRRTMPEDSVVKTKSYIELQSLLGSDTKS